jgi:hypothetical protein
MRRAAMTRPLGGKEAASAYEGVYARGAPLHPRPGPRRAHTARGAMRRPAPPRRACPRGVPSFRERRGHPTSGRPGAPRRRPESPGAPPAHPGAAPPPAAGAPRQVPAKARRCAAPPARGRDATGA